MISAKKKKIGETKKKKGDREKNTLFFRDCLFLPGEKRQKITNGHCKKK